MRSWEDLLCSLLSGGSAKATVVSVGAPLERIKILLQNQNMAPDCHRRYTSVKDLATRITKEQGVRAFWRGNLANCLRVIPNSALRFTFMDHFQALAASVVCSDDDAGRQLPLHGQLLSGGMSGAVTMLIVYPFDLTRTVLAADVGATRQYIGIVDCMRQTTRQHGWRGHYRGLLVSLLEITPYTGLSMGGYEYFKRLLPSDDAARASWWLQAQRVGVGSLSGLAASLFCYPMDTVKRQLMLDGSSGFRSRYAGSVCACVRVLYREGGLRVFYNGCLFNAIKSSMGAGLTFTINDLFRSLTGYRVH